MRHVILLASQTCDSLIGVGTSVQHPRIPPRVDLMYHDKGVAFPERLRSSLHTHQFQNRGCFQKGAWVASLYVKVVGVGSAVRCLVMGWGVS